jgi:hypothetical protein
MKLPLEILQQIQPAIEEFRLTPSQLSSWLKRHHGITVSRQAVFYKMNQLFDDDPLEE